MHLDQSKEGVKINFEKVPETRINKGFSDSQNLQFENEISKRKNRIVFNVVTQDDFERILKSLSVGEQLTPTLFGMNGKQRQNFYNWCNNSENVKKVNNKYIKVS